jgi:hypothetical protein
MRTYRVDGFWLDGCAPVHLHTFDAATQNSYREFSGGADIPLQPGGVPLALAKTSDGVVATVPTLCMHAMVVFE